MIAREGVPFVIAPLVAGAVLIWLGVGLAGGACLVLSGAIAFFFRDPERHPPREAGVIVAPADGKVVKVERGADGTVVSIFLSLFDVHINRAPIAGVVTDVSYRPGRFMIATRDEASEANEQNRLTIEGEGVRVVCKQIAGVVARRIVCWKRVGDRVERGERIGLIRFGSRTELVLPAAVEVEIGIGARVRGGETVIGRLK